MTKKRGGNNLHMLDGQQRGALGQYAKDFQTALPHMQAFAKTAQRLHKEMVDAPVWRVVESPKPGEQQQEPEMWSVGHAKINYVDHIEHEGAQDK